MSADEVFVLVLVIVCALVVGAAAIHSRRQQHASFLPPVSLSLPDSSSFSARKGEPCTKF